MFNEVIEISYFCRIPSGGVGFDELSPVIRLPSQRLAEWSEDIVRLQSLVRPELDAFERLVGH